MKTHLFTILLLLIVCSANAQEKNDSKSGLPSSPNEILRELPSSTSAVAAPAENAQQTKDAIAGGLLPPQLTAPQPMTEEKRRAPSQPRNDGFYDPLPGRNMHGRNLLDYPSSALPSFPPNSVKGLQGDEYFDPNTMIWIEYAVSRPVEKTVHTPQGVEYRNQTFSEVMTLRRAIRIDSDLDKLELEGDGKRAAVQAITAHRHDKLLLSLKEAKSEAEKVQAAKLLEENYRAHYAIETQWRNERITELEKRIAEMRKQVQQRADSEEKYIEAAMTLAKLHAEGIAAEPPQLKRTIANPVYGGKTAAGTIPYPADGNNSPGALGTNYGAMTAPATIANPAVW